MTSYRRALPAWLIVGAVGYFLLPWYALQDTVLGIAWLPRWAGSENAPAILQAFRHGRTWLLPLAVLLVAGTAMQAPGLGRRARANGLVAIGATGFVYIFVQGFAIGSAGWAFETLAQAFGPLAGRQYGMGLGACLVASAFAMILSLGLADRGFFKGDAFVAGAFVAVGAARRRVHVLSRCQDPHPGPPGQRRRVLVFRLLAARLTTEKIWGLSCIAGARRCGVAWNTLLLATACAIGCTALGLAFALVVTRTKFRYKKFLRVLSVLPIITPPFVVGLGLILLFGRSGLVNQLLEWTLAITPTRWLYGLQGVLVAQVFAFTPIAFLVLIGVVEGVSPALEEAAQTLRAGQWRTFVDVSLPLMRPGIANAFLITFIESIADFGNPILLGGNFGVLSTEIFFSVVGAQLDQGRAATLGIVLLVFALGAFFLQRRVLGAKVYTTLSGKGDSGLPTPLPAGARRLCYGVVLPWVFLTIVIYGMALAGGFVETWGRDYTLTLKHYVKAFGIEWGPHGILWVGAAWNSFWTTVRLSAIAAPLTAAIGILAAWLLTRQNFAGRALFEFGTMLSFAIPGTVIGVSYILAFNVPPIEITGTAIILVVCNIFRNMPVGVRAGMASMAQSRSQPRRGVDDAWCTQRDDVASRPAAPAEASRGRRARVQLRSRNDDRVRRDLPRLRAIRMGDDLHHQPGRQRRLRRGHRLQFRADRAHAGRHLGDPVDVGDRRLGRRSAVTAKSATLPARPRNLQNREP